MRISSSFTVIVRVERSEVSLRSSKGKIKDYDKGSGSVRWCKG